MWPIISRIHKNIIIRLIAIKTSYLIGIMMLIWSERNSMRILTQNDDNEITWSTKVPRHRIRIHLHIPRYVTLSRIDRPRTARIFSYREWSNSCAFRFMQQYVKTGQKWCIVLDGEWMYYLIRSKKFAEVRQIDSDLSE